MDFYGDLSKKGIINVLFCIKIILEGLRIMDPIYDHLKGNNDLRIL